MKSVGIFWVLDNVLDERPLFVFGSGPYAIAFPFLGGLVVVPHVWVVQADPKVYNVFGFFGEDENSGIRFTEPDVVGIKYVFARKAEKDLTDFLVEVMNDGITVEHEDNIVISKSISDDENFGPVRWYIHIIEAL